MEKFCFLIAVFALVLLNFFPVCCFAKTTFNLTTDEEALLAFKSRITSDPSNILSSNWSTTRNASICSWIGVSCGAKQRITALRLSGLNLGGTIAPHLGNLTFLSSLDLSFNRFTGPVPDELARLRRLKWIILESNSFTGRVPLWLGDLAKLEFIFLGSNNLTGVIPNLFNLSSLEILNMSYNPIHGNIPTGIGNLSRLRSLDLKYNQLTGLIPSSVFNISSLEKFDLTMNNLSGPIPVNLCENLSRLEQLSFSVNQLTGSIPANLYKCRALRHLSLSFNQFSGSIPREIGELTMLKKLFLGANNFKGGIPPEIGNLTNLEIFSMWDSSLTGEIPSFVFNMSSLKHINLAKNNLSGSFPLDIHLNLPNLEELYLHLNLLTGEILPSLLNCDKLQIVQLKKNQFTGAIPKQVGNMTQLKILYLSDNNMTGEIPSELGNLNVLERLALADNDMFGQIPFSIFNTSTLIELELSFNRFDGRFPANIGSSLPNLEFLYVANNSLTGPLPSSINNASKLSILEMGSNSFTGPIPDFGSLRHLKWLVMSNNNLTVESQGQELSFISALQDCRYLEMLDISLNHLNGIIPNTIGNLSTSLKNLRAYGCKIKGSIPAELGNLSSLSSIHMDWNELTGVIPAELGKLKQVQGIYLEYNRLIGRIPNELCELKMLADLYLSGNMLNGTIPGCLGELKSLRRVFLDSNRLTSDLPNFWNLNNVWGLNLSTNLLSGTISSEIENLKVLVDLDFSWNQFSGDIPSSIGNIDSLVTLSLAHNHFKGSIPQSLGNLRGLESLDLSNNNFSGLIPKSLEDLRYIRYFNVSYNRLEGEIPTGGRFADFIAQSFMQNYALCGPPRLQVPLCKIRAVKGSGSKHVSLIKYIVAPIASSVILAVAIALWLIRRKNNNKKAHMEVSPLAAWRRVSYQELVEATGGFLDFNLLGSGSFGSVFKGTLSDGLNVAVKVFNMQLERAIASFEVECEIMSNVRHRNLVRVISCCSNTDFKALVLEHMPNGSLEKWLYSHNYCLDLLQRLNIAIDVAVALEYLHHGNSFPIVHCDLKPSNVLLDEDMTAHVGDFGISKLFAKGEAIIQTITLATVGYMAPEYGSDGKVSINGDVYSYGVMLLEILTRKKPTDDMFSEEMSLKDLVSEALQENAVTEVVAPGLLARDDEHFFAKKQCISSIFGLAMECLAFSPEERINMIEMVVDLKKIKATFLAGTRRRNEVARLNH